MDNYKEIAQAIAQYMGEGWRVEAGNAEWYFILKNRNRYEIGFFFNYYGASTSQRIRITGRGGVRSDNITVSYKRSPQALAKDIINRFMPSFVKAFDKRQAQEKTNKKDAAYKQYIAQAIIKVNPASTITRQETGELQISVKNVNYSYERFQLYGSRVLISNLSLTPTQAIKLAYIMGQKD